MSYNPYASYQEERKQHDASAQVNNGNFQQHQQFKQQYQPPHQGQFNQPPQQFGQQQFGQQQQQQTQHFGQQQQAPQFANNFQNFFNDPQAQLMQQIGTSTLQQGTAYMQNNLNQYINTNQIRFYFKVSNSYVFKKCKLILFPFTHKAWSRGSSQDSFLPPAADVNCPDLYIPTMGFITYILMWNIFTGLTGSFNPEMLYYKSSSTLAFLLLDLSILKLALYVLGVNALPILELWSYVGYKFVPILTILSFRMTTTWFGMEFSSMWSILLQVYLYAVYGFYLLRSVKFNLVSTTAGTSYNSRSLKTVNYFLFLYGFVWQGLVMWWMS